MVATTLLKTVQSRLRAYPVGATLPIRCHLGLGQLIHLTRCGFAGVKLIGETRIEEVPLTCLVKL